MLLFFYLFVFREAEYFLYTFAIKTPNISLILAAHLGGKGEVRPEMYFSPMHSFTFLYQIGQTFLVPQAGGIPVWLTHNISL